MNRCKVLFFGALFSMGAAVVPANVVAQSADLVPPDGWAGDPPTISSLVEFAEGESNLRTAVIRYVQDKAGIERRYPVLYSPARMARLREFHNGWKQQLQAVDFESLNYEGQVDYIVLRNRIDYNLEMLTLDEQRAKDIAPLIPFFDEARALEETRLDRKRANPREAAATLDHIARTATELADSLRVDANEAGGLVTREDLSKVAATRAANQLEHLREILSTFNAFYDGFDPLYTFWAGNAHEAADAAMQTYADALREYVVGAKPGETPPTIGDPVLAEGLRADLAVEMIPYNAEELIEIGRQEFDWIRQQMTIVSNDMGLGDDWKAALEHTKDLAPPPGEAAWAIFDIAAYEEQFIEDMGVVTLAPLAREIWRLAMSSPERQLHNPFFSGGEVTSLSYPEISMSYQQKVMSMRGNTPHFNFPTVHHELVPGHHLQPFMFRRFNNHRAELNRTPFWSEGWAVYWEFLLWDQPDFPRNNPDKMGMLFWRLHRAARIVFSLNYQLGRWTPEQCVEFLVDEVGHERANAEAEVRRTTMSAPLYQMAYMMGAIQLRALYSELVDSGQITEQEFYNGYLIGGPMPIEMLRARFSRQELTRDYQSNWRFYDSLPEK
jgi:hypothetical protein